MKTKPDVYATCDSCGKEIYYGNTVVSFQRNIEQVDRTPTFPDGEVTVVNSVQLVTLCGSCGNRFEAEHAREVLKTALARPPHSRN